MLKNTVATKSLSQQRGELCEEWVVEWLLVRKIKIIGRRLKVFGVEIDLMAQAESGLLILIEVKSLRRGEWLERRVVPKQRRRLRRVAQNLAEGVPWRGTHGEREVELWLATVGESKSSVQVYQDL